jgi:inosine-uridine nucleoside N-ribohydrolase
VAFVINPNLFTTQFMRVDVDTFPSSYGRTICDVYSFSKLPKNVTVALKINVQEFWNLMFDSFEKANSVSILNKI